MKNIPAKTLVKILELRSKNGLDATEEALAIDLQKSKAQWTLEETPRYRQAGDSPIYVSGKYLTALGFCPATGEKDTGHIYRPTGKKAAAKSSEVAVGTVSEEVFLKVLHGKGFNVSLALNLLTGEVEREVPPPIEALGLKFSTIPAIASSVHITQANPQIQVAMSLDKFLELARISPNAS